MACVGNKERQCPTQPLLRMVMAETYAQTLFEARWSAMDSATRTLRKYGTHKQSWFIPDEL